MKSHSPGWALCGVDGDCTQPGASTSNLGEDVGEDRYVIRSKSISLLRQEAEWFLVQPITHRQRPPSNLHGLAFLVSHNSSRLMQPCLIEVTMNGKQMLTPHPRPT
ncbi:hypothetical protein J3458_003366 [Metarhizium acridum]|uniref:uncharacterized protein n=1 Tax=Metarhizium acridum TaxID=92637 RepID=UPI001C6CF06D|nr:hypothetical protein J3458_003366 [Metarhizium acridum]